MSVSIDDFNKMDLKVGKVLKAEKILNLTKLLKLDVDIGSRSIQVLAGGAEFYQPEHFVGRKVIVLTNIMPRIVAGVESAGMLLAADYNGKPFWLTVEEDVPSGTKVR